MIRRFLQKEGIENYRQLVEFIIDYKNSGKTKNFFENRTSEDACAIIKLEKWYDRDNHFKLQTLFADISQWGNSDTGVNIFTKIPPYTSNNPLEWAKTMTEVPEHFMAAHKPLNKSEELSMPLSGTDFITVSLETDKIEREVHDYLNPPKSNADRLWQPQQYNKLLESIKKKDTGEITSLANTKPKTDKPINDNFVEEVFEYCDKIGKGSEGKKESSGKLFYEFDWGFIEAVAQRMQENKGKYEKFNWQKNIDIEELKQSLFRHVIEIMKGEYKDGEDELGHITAIACNAQMIWYQLKNNKYLTFPNL